MIHLGKGEIRDFLAGRLDTEGRRRVLGHLRSRCSHCQRRLQALAESLLSEEPWTAVEPVPEEQYDEVLSQLGPTARSLDRRWRKEREKLERALALLDQAPAGLGDESIPWSQARALHGWPMCEALLRKSYEARFSNPERMLRLAKSAAGMAKHIKQEKYPWPGFLTDLRIRALGELGNAYRLNHQFADADAAFNEALEILEEEGTGDPLVHARVLDLVASLRMAQRRLDDAIAILDQLYNVYLDAEEPHLAGRALISKGINKRCQGQPREAVSLLQSGLRLLQPERDPQLGKIGQQALLDALADCGEYREASRQLLRSGLRQAFESEPFNLLKLQWVEGKIHAGLGRPAKAERDFARVRQEFLRLGRFYDAALVGLELAGLWLRQGKAAQVLLLAEEMHETFAELGVEWEAGKALYFMREACRLQSVTVSMIERIRTFLERLLWNPGMRFEPALYAP